MNTFITWEYQDCEEGFKKGQCCQECIASGEKLCCECRDIKENATVSQFTHDLMFTERDSTKMILEGEGTWHNPDTPKMKLEVKGDYKKSLSDKRWLGIQKNDWNYTEEDVKEFIKELKKEIGSHIEGNGFYSQIINIIDKIAGEKLI